MFSWAPTMLWRKWAKSDVKSASRRILMSPWASFPLSAPAISFQKLQSWYYVFTLLHQLPYLTVFEHRQASCLEVFKLQIRNLNYEVSPPPSRDTTPSPNTMAPAPPPPRLETGQTVASYSAYRLGADRLRHRTPVTVLRQPALLRSRAGGLGAVRLEPQRWRPASPDWACAACCSAPPPAGAPPVSPGPPRQQHRGRGRGRGQWAEHGLAADLGLMWIDWKDVQWCSLVSWVAKTHFA